MFSPINWTFGNAVTYYWDVRKWSRKVSLANILYRIPKNVLQRSSFRVFHLRNTRTCNAKPFSNLKNKRRVEGLTSPRWVQCELLCWVIYCCDDIQMSVAHSTEMSAVCFCCRLCVCGVCASLKMWIYSSIYLRAVRYGQEQYIVSSNHCSL